MEDFMVLHDLQQFKLKRLRFQMVHMSPVPTTRTIILVGYLQSLYMALYEELTQKMALVVDGTSDDLLEPETSVALRFTSSETSESRDSRSDREVGPKLGFQYIPC